MLSFIVIISPLFFFFLKTWHTPFMPPPPFHSERYSLTCPHKAHILYRAHSQQWQIFYSLDLAYPLIGVPSWALVTSVCRLAVLGSRIVPCFLVIMTFCFVYSMTYTILSFSTQKLFLVIQIHCLFLHFFFFQMWSWGKWLKVLMDPEPVWQFQSYFGVQKVGKTWHFSSVPDPDPLVWGMYPKPDPDPSISKQNNKKNLDSYFFWTFYLWKMM